LSGIVSDDFTSIIKFSRLLHYRLKDVN